jgi:CBS domain-containing protein
LTNIELYEIRDFLTQYPPFNTLPVGVVELTDIVRYESQNSLFLVNSIFQQPSVEDLETLSHQVKDCFVRMVNEDANSHMVGSAMAVIARPDKKGIKITDYFPFDAA